MRNESRDKGAPLRVISEIRKSVVGKDEAIIKTFLAILSGGHILIDDIPGVGKTTMAIAFSRALGLSENRIQFTPDVTPSDITGFSLYRKESGSFEYQPGAVMCNLLLADEINRTSPKTQSALLEAMEESKVTVDGTTHPLPKPFTVIATQNPIGSAGTQALPLSQLDRFMVCISMGYPSPEDEAEIIKNKYTGEEVSEILSAEELENMKQICSKVFLHDAVLKYTVTLVNATRKNSGIQLGVSPRGTFAVVRMSKAMACLRGRDFVTPEDVADVFIDSCVHRIVLDPSAEVSGTTAGDILREILRTVPKPALRAKS